MMPRAQIVPALLAALATIVISIPLTSLFSASSWALPAGLGVLVVAATGVLLRSSLNHTGVTILGQIVVGSAYVLVTQLGETTLLGVVPTPETLTRLVEHVDEAQRTITEYAAPAPETPGITVTLVMIIMIVGLAVDMSAATASSPAIAGLPLFSLFLVSAANSGGALAWGWFLVGAGLWLAMLTYQSGIDLRQWTTSVPMLGHHDAQGDAERSLRWQAVRVSAVGLAIAMLVPAAMPHMPTRYVLDGMGRGGSGAGQDTDGIRLATDLDLKKSLEDPSEDPVLTYTTNDPTPEPLRVAVVEDFTDGFGRMRSAAREPQSSFQPEDPLARVPEEIPRESRNFVVESNGVSAPQLALPDNVTSADLDGIDWSIGADRTARVQRKPDAYSATFSELQPDTEHFDGSVDEPIDPAANRSAYVNLDPGSAEEIQDLADELAPEDGGPLADAQAIQEYLRGPDFTYSLDIPRPSDGPDDPILSFLETKTGYCQQYAATMTLLARARDIPARVVVGFLPGTDGDDETTLVRASDAHAWPELYFESVGWVRFEPTKGTRAASIPGYSINTDDGPNATSETTEEPETSTTTSSEEAPAPEDEATPEADEESWLSRWSGWILTALLALAALAIVPVTAVLARRRERTTSANDLERIEHEWRDLIDRIEDLGIEPPPGATPRDLGAWLTRRAHLEGEAQGRLDHVVTTLERARYGRPGQDLPDISSDVSAVVGEVRDQRMRSTRLRAALWPRAGVDAWLALPRRATGALRRLVRRDG